MERRLRAYGPLAAALLAMVVVWFVWDIRDPASVEHDQGSYLLQAEIFASGRWTAPAPAAPDFFDQPHVQTQPRLASKYPPGHALMLTPGAVVGAPWLMPLLLTGATGALLFALVSRVANSWAAAFACVFWITAPMTLHFQGSWFSELTTAPLLLASWWCLLEWRDTRHPRWIVLVALAFGWSAITRPLTALAHVIPVGVVVLRDVAQRGLWRQLGLGLATGCVFLGVIVPLWNARTTGSWRESPVTKYMREYIPVDRPGFGLDSTSSTPTRLATMDPVQRAVYENVRDFRRDLTIPNLPRVLAQRLLNLAIGWFQGWRLPLIAAAVVGLVAGGVTMRFAAASAAAHVAAYLTHAHWEKWTLYYLELTPVVAALTGVGLFELARRRLPLPRAAMVAGGLAVLLLVASAPSIDSWRRRQYVANAFYRAFTERANALQPQPAIVFVRYPDGRRSYPAVVRNSANLAGESVWIVHDLGARNAELTRLAPNRAVFHIDVGQQ